MSRPIHIVIALFAVVGCGAARPYEQRQGVPFLKAATATATVSPRGYRVELAAQCQAQIINYWCPTLGSSEMRRTCTTPPTVTRAAVLCPPELGFKTVTVTLRTPWGVTYDTRSDEQGVAEFPVDWGRSGIDPLAEDAATQLSTNWLVTSPSGFSTELRVTPQDVETMRIAIGEATDTQYEMAPEASAQRTTLQAKLVEVAPLVAGRAGTVSLSITNTGRQPAHRVISNLKSSLEPLDDIRLSFGRIDPGKTKVRTRTITLPAVLDDYAPLVLATVSSGNGDEFSVKQRFAIGKPPSNAGGVVQAASLDLTCQPVSLEVLPGEPVRVSCELRNKSKSPANELRVEVVVNGVSKKGIAPKKLAAGEAVKLEFVGAAPVAPKDDADLPVKVTVSGADVEPVTQSLTVRVPSLVVKCKGKKLTRQEYSTKRKGLEDAFKAGSLTQKEVDKYDADLLICCCVKP